MTMLAQVREDARFLALLLEALESPLEILIVVNDDFRQGSEPLLAANREPNQTVRGLLLCARPSGLSSVVSLSSERASVVIPSAARDLLFQNAQPVPDEEEQITPAANSCAVRQEDACEDEIPFAPHPHSC